MKYLIFNLFLMNFDYFIFSEFWENNQFKIHGLWPQYSYNSYPSYCSIEKFDYSKLELLTEDLANVQKYNKKNNTILEDPCRNNK